MPAPTETGFKWYFCKDATSTNHGCVWKKESGNVSWSKQESLSQVSVKQIALLITKISVYYTACRNLQSKSITNCLYISRPIQSIL